VITNILHKSPDHINAMVPPPDCNLWAKHDMVANFNYGARRNYLRPVSERHIIANRNIFIRIAAERIKTEPLAVGTEAMPVKEHHAPPQGTYGKIDQFVFYLTNVSHEPNRRSLDVF
jgi:hypothetical protein